MLQWIIKTHAAGMTLPSTGDNDLGDILHGAAIYNLIDVGDYDCSFAWRFGHGQRRWQIAARSPSAAIVHVLREFCLYEFLHGRKVAILARQEHLWQPLKEALVEFFGVQTSRRRLEALMHLQQRRVLEMFASSTDRPEFGSHSIDKYSPGNLVCHATDATAAGQIIRDRQILSPCRVRQLPGQVLAAEPRNAAGDPPDYFDYVMFGPAVHPGLDKLVNERLLGRAPSWADMELGFVPAIRFFFRRQDVLRHLRFQCDGLHEKVRDAMELIPCLVAALIPNDVPDAAELKTELQKAVPAASLLELSRGNDGPEAWARRVAGELARLGVI